MAVSVDKEAQQVVNTRQFNWHNVFMVVAMSWGAFAYGYSTAIIGPTLGLSSFTSSDEG